MNAFESLIAARQSCRDFNGTPVSREEMEKIVACGRIAPSACNCQPWHFYVAQGASLEKLLPALHPKFAGIGGALVIAEVQKPLPFSPENPYRQMDIGLAVMQMALGAEALGLASCIVGSFDKDMARSVLCAPKDEILRLVLAVGTPTDPTLRQKDRLAESQTVTWL